MKARDLPGGEILGFLPLSMIGLEAVNDLYLRYAFPGWITGKLGDIAALVWVPIFLSSVGGAILWFVGLAWSPSSTANGTIQRKSGSSRTLAALTLTALVFALINLSPACTDLYVSMLDVVDPRDSVGFHRYTRDPTDLLMLPALVLPYRYLRARTALAP